MGKVTEPGQPDWAGQPDPAGPPVGPGRPWRRFRHAGDPWQEWLRRAEHAAVDRGHGVPIPAWLRKTPGEQRWPVTLSVIAAIVLQVLLPPDYTKPLPAYLLPALEGALLIGLSIANPVRIERRGKVIRAASMVLIGLITIANATSAVILIRAILEDASERFLRMESSIRAIPARDALISLAEHVLTNLRDNPKVFRVIFFGVMEKPRFAGVFYRTFLAKILALETRLFRRAFLEASTRRSMPAAHADPRVVARSFHGSLLFYNLAGAVIRVEPLPRNTRALAESIVNLYLPEAKA